jgi:hypothetical protein
MQVTEEQRRALYERLREHLDDDTATLVMEVTVPANVELATPTDIHELRAELLLRITEVDGHLTLQIADLARRLGEIDSRIGERIGGLEIKIVEVGAMLSHKLMWRAVPVIAGVAVLLVTLASWLGR